MAAKTKAQPLHANGVCSLARQGEVGCAGLFPEKAKAVFAPQVDRPAKRLCQARRANSVPEVVRQPLFKFRLAICTQGASQSVSDSCSSKILHRFPRQPLGCVSSTQLQVSCFLSGLQTLATSAFCLPSSPSSLRQRPQAGKLALASWSASSPASPAAGASSSSSVLQF